MFTRTPTSYSCDRNVRPTESTGEESPQQRETSARRAGQTEDGTPRPISEDLHRLG